MALFLLMKNAVFSAFTLKDRIINRIGGECV